MAAPRVVKIIAQIDFDEEGDGQPLPTEEEAIQTLAESVADDTASFTIEFDNGDTRTF